MRRHNAEGFHVDRARPDSHDNPEPSQGPDDATVIRRSWREPEQFALLFHRHAASLSRYATRRLGPQLAEDIVADTFLTAFRQRDRYDPSRADARPWLYGIAANLIRRYHRDETRWLQALERTGIDPVADSEPAALGDSRWETASGRRRRFADKLRACRRWLDPCVLLDERLEAGCSGCGTSRRRAVLTRVGETAWPGVVGAHVLGLLAAVGRDIFAGMAQSQVRGARDVIAGGCVS